MRRRTLLAAACAALPALPRLARAQTYPAHPIRLIAGFPAGGQIDIIARLTAQSLGQALKQTVVVENKPGVTLLLRGTRSHCSISSGHTVNFW